MHTSLPASAPALAFEPVALPPGVPAHRLVPRPGPLFGPYPSREPPALAASGPMAWLQARLRVAAMPGDAARKRFIAVARDQWRRLRGLPQDELDAWLSWLRTRLAVDGFTNTRVAESFGLIALVVERELGFKLHDTQMLAGWWMLGNRLVEMATGEGKTLAVFLAAATGALAGIPVHVLTANDYLAERDAEHQRALYRALGLTVGCVTGSSTEDQRRAAYGCDVTFAPAREVVFDHLRDRAGLSGDAGPVLRGLCMAVVDEADSVLIDEARMPLVLSRQRAQRDAFERQRLALFLARQLKAGEHFTTAGPQPELTDAGCDQLARLSQRLAGPWRHARLREEQVGLALAALFSFERDVDYLVRDGEVHIIDATTGRLAIGRSWSRGLHQLIALKEGLAPQPENDTLLQTSYQRFFPRYLRLCGLSGTLTEVHAELLAIYGLPVARVPLRVPSRRVAQPARLFERAEPKWAAVAARVQALYAEGRPVLVGTGSVADSETLSALLAAAGVPHQVLNARHDAAEAAIVARAGEVGAVTVSTQMAGRGTDIPLGPGVEARGGLHVIHAHLPASARVDRQLAGRCARQGTPGSHERLLSLDEELFARALPGPLLALVRALARRPAGVPPLLARAVQARAQAWTERREREERWRLLQHDLWMGRGLAWAGKA